MRLKDKVALITGSGAGIGKAIAQRFAAEGATVIINDVSEEGAKVASDIVETGGRACFMQMDLRSEEEVRCILGTVRERFGRLDTLINNAGVRGTSHVVNTSEEEWERIINTNLRGAWYCCKYAIPLMIEGGGGSIVNMSSTHVMRTQENHFPYHAAKGGMHAMTLGICVDFGAQGIRANNLCPGFIWTPMSEKFMSQFPDRADKEQAMLSTHPVGRFGTPEDVAKAALFLASDESSYISGTSLTVDGGRSAYQKAD